MTRDYINARHVRNRKAWKIIKDIDRRANDVRIMFDAYYIAAKTSKLPEEFKADMKHIFGADPVRDIVSGIGFAGTDYKDDYTLVTLPPFLNYSCCVESFRKYCSCIGLDSFFCWTGAYNRRRLMLYNIRSEEKSVVWKKGYCYAEISGGWIDRRGRELSEQYKALMQKEDIRVYRDDSVRDKRFTYRLLAAVFGEKEEGELIKEEQWEEVHEKLLECLNSIRPVCRKLIVSHFRDSMSYTKMAFGYLMTVNAVRHTIAEGLRCLRLPGRITGLSEYLVTDSSEYSVQEEQNHENNQA